MYYIYPQVILAFTIALYLYGRYKRQEVKNLTTLGLAIGFMSFGFVGLSQFAISSHLLLWDYKILYFLRYLFMAFAFVSIFWSVLKLVSTSRFYSTFFPLLVLVSALVGGYVGVFIWQNIQLTTAVAVYAIYIPVDLSLGILFLLLYSRLAFIKDGFKNNLGPFLISLGWFIHTINASRIPFVLDRPEMEKYLLIVAIPYIFWLIGFILLERETKKAFEIHLKVHGLRKKEGEGDEK